jgi:hypothetical protein
VKDTGGLWFCANDWWYDCFKPWLVKQVGFGADQPELRTTEVYDVAYDALYEQLPDCRNCRCIRIDPGPRPQTHFANVERLDVSALDTFEQWRKTATELVTSNTGRVTIYHI